MTFPPPLNSLENWNALVGLVTTFKNIHSKAGTPYLVGRKNLNHPPLPPGLDNVPSFTSFIFRWLH